MIFKNKKLPKTITLFLFFCLANSTVFALIPEENISADTTSPNVLYTGILNTADPLSVRVNGNIAQDGMTILSGAEIKTINNGTAVVKMYQLGKVELNRETSIKLVFSAQNIDVQVLSGKAVLTTYKGVKGKLTETNGKVLITDSTLEISSVGNSAGVLLPEISAASPTLFGFGFGLWGAIGIAASTAVILITVAESNDAEEIPISNVRP